MLTTASSLARAFGIILRQVCQLFNTVNEMYANGNLQNLNISYQEANELHVSWIVFFLIISFHVVFIPFSLISMASYE